MIRRYRLCLVGLVETKISGLKADQVCKKLDLNSWIRIEAVGFSGGIWVLWKDCIKLEVIRTHPQFIHLEVQVAGHDPWLLSIVYGSPAPHLRKFLWQDLNLSGIDLLKPWLVVCDFNSIVFVEETSSTGNFDNRKCSTFIS